MAAKTLKGVERALEAKRILVKTIRRGKRFLDVAVAAFADEVLPLATFPFAVEVRGSWWKTEDHSRNPDAVIYRVRLNR